MKFLLKLLEKQDHHFQKGGKFEKLHALWDAQSTFLFTPAEVTTGGPHIRDKLDLKRLMITVVVALLPCVFFAFYNAGYQAALAAGTFPLVPQLSDHLQIFINGALLCAPIILVSYAVGGFWEALFVSVRGHKMTEGFLVTGILFPLTLPVTIPLWQVAIGISFGVVIGKEIFGGTGMNILNPALTARVFLFFAFPIEISGDRVWISHGKDVVDGFSGATALAVAAATPRGGDAALFLSQNQFSDFSLWNLFIGLVPGSIGETSALACLLGALVLILTGVGSWQIMVSVIAGGAVTAWGLNYVAGPNLPGYLSLPPLYHLFMGGFMFGAVFMATDPVSAASTGRGKYIYGFLVGALAITIRIWNPAYPEGMMLAILFMNIFAPLIDHFVIQGNIKRRLKRATA